MLKRMLIVTSALSVCSAHAAIVTFTDRSAWESALGQTPDLSEDFKGFLVDAPFRDAPLSIRVGAIERTAGSTVTCNEGGVSLFDFDYNGTNIASIFVDSDGPGKVAVTFLNPLVPFGGDFYNTETGRA